MAWRFTQHFFGDRTEQQMFEPASTMRTHHDQVRGQRGGTFDDLSSWLTHIDENIDADTVGARPLKQRSRFGPHPRQFGIGNAIVGGLYGKRLERWTLDMKGRNRRLVPPRERDGMIDRML